MDKLFECDSTDSEELSSLHGIDEESITDFIANGTREEIHPVVYEAPIFQDNLKQINFILANVKHGIGKFTHYKYVCLINKVDEKQDKGKCPRLGIF